MSRETLTAPVRATQAQGSSTWKLLLFACALALGLLLLALADLRGPFGRVASGGLLAEVEQQIRASPITMGRVYAFFAKLVLLYLLLGAAAWGLACLTLAAFPCRLRWRYAIVAGWMLGLGFVVGLANASAFPWSGAGIWSRAVQDFLALPIPLWTVVAASMAASIVVMLIIWIRRRGIPVHLPRITAWACVLVVALLCLRHVPVADEAMAGSHDPSRPNIILIGIDSLRPELVGQRDRFGYMPSLTAFVDSGHRFVDATTPLARTFPSWMAMLTGQRPGTSGIRENLMPRSKIDVTTLPSMLSVHGYQTVFATDDVRFSNIDRSYGFETTLTPRIGVTDFLLGGLADLPLVNLVANTLVGKWFFPDSYANRAAAVTYDPATFVAWLDSDVNPDGRPLFLAMHLTLAHYPYHWREDTDAVFSQTTDTAYAYLSSVVEVDRQFASLTRMLEKKGLLRNTFVVVFSDHGEGLNLPADRKTLFAATDLGIEGVPVWSSGHGNTVLSESQFQILMAARSFGVVGYNESRGAHKVPVSIEDVAPTVLDIVGLDTSKYTFDGLSFAPQLKRASQEEEAHGPLRVRFTETGYTTPALQKGMPDELSLIKESMGFFRVNQETGWVEVNGALWDHFMQIRERAAVGPTQLLAALPARRQGETWYVLASRTGGAPRKLLERPGPELGPEAQALWDGLASEFAGELGSPAP